MPLAAHIIGLVIVALGIVGLAVPDYLPRLAWLTQSAPVLYIAAVVRVAFGIVLLLAAPKARIPNALRILGVLMVLGGALTPFFGARLAEAILAWWARDLAVIRAWATAALAVGVFIVYATGYRRRAA
jgi:hypothetical protein